MSVRFVENSLRAMAIRTESIVHGHVLPVPERKAEPMDADYREKLVAYRTSMSLAENMLFQGIITETDYGKIDRIIAKKYGLSLCSIYCRKPLITPQNRGNMRHTKGGDVDGADNQES